ncbi:hypothetical protein BsIDN1_52620 [Bacillus safensis]|uniref:Uncharacterized protein n=1 Tax=Bacillus safensis TaxID=561879 RepID=A0A5S9MHK5_BACIA|nr:hypothetical protein BsIDN1_52620 [Bacillus safensis]
MKSSGKNTAPTKHQQFKATKALLAYGESDSKKKTGMARLKAWWKVTKNET